MDRRTALKTFALGGSAGLPLGLFGCHLPPPITVAGNRSFEHPESEADLVRLVVRARSLGLQLRVRGSLHSVGSAIFTDGGNHINVQLDRYNKVLGWDDANQQVTVQAGIHLGVDPLDPASDRSNSLLYQMEEKGWALPDLGGITHQTVGGFLSTGSTGGTVHYDIGDAIVCIRIVAGDGNVYELEPNPDDPRDRDVNPFYGACVSMGLFGVISTVTFRCVDRYDLIGTQVTASYGKSPVDIFGVKGGGLKKWMEEEEYNRVLVWPQKKVEKVQLWGARRTTAADRPVTHRGDRFVARPAEQVPKVLQAVAHEVFEFVDRSPPPYDPARVAVLQTAINAFITPGTERFWDAWLECLPMDNLVSDNYLPTEFTELFIDLERTPDVMKTLGDYWAEDRRMERTGPYATEIYPSRESRFWMSPTYGRKNVRVDVFWFKSGKTDPDQVFYPQYWDLLAPFDFRFHWGKHLSAPDSATGVAYRRKNAPHWDTFLRWRAKFDPDQVFVTSYWRNHLGIGPKESTPAIGGETLVSEDRQKLLPLPV